MFMLLDVAALAQDSPGSAGAPIPATVAADPAQSYDQLYQRARTFSSAGQHDLAIATFSLLLERSPGNADVLLGRGQAYARLDQFDKAEQDLKAAAAAAPEYADVWAALVQTYTWAGRP